MKNEFSYYNTTPLITWPVVINPDHLLLCGPHAHTHSKSISHNTFAVALPLSLTPTALNIPLSVFIFPLSALRLSPSFHQFFFRCLPPPTQFPLSCYLRQNRTLSLPMISETSPTSSSGKTRWSMTVAGQYFPALGESVRMTSAAASS